MRQTRAMEAESDMYAMPGNSSFPQRARELDIARDAMFLYHLIVCDAVLSGVLCRLSNSSTSPALPTHSTSGRLYSAFFACSRRRGAVVALFSRSAAHKAAPTVLVKANIKLANGTISKTNAATPKLE